MRKIANYKNRGIRDRQLNIFVDFLRQIQEKEELEIFVKTFLTESEKAYLSQRLEIMRMLTKNFTYKEIAEKLKVSPVTIVSASKCLDSSEAKFWTLILEYHNKSDYKKIEKDSHDPKFFPRYPGAIL